MALSRRLRFEILKRDGYACRYCGATAPDVVLQVDHVLPTTLGGGDEPNNLVTACADCNSGKASTHPDSAVVEDVDAAAILFAKAAEKAAERRRAQLEGLDATLVEFDEQWMGYHTNPYVGQPAQIPRPNDWAQSVSRFLEQGLTLPELKHFTAVAMNSKADSGQVFRYFCGCCWREISERQELARRMIEDGEV